MCVRFRVRACALMFASVRAWVCACIYVCACVSKFEYKIICACGACVRDKVCSCMRVCGRTHCEYVYMKARVCV